MARPGSSYSQRRDEAAKAKAAREQARAARKGTTPGAPTVETPAVETVSGAPTEPTLPTEPTAPTAPTEPVKPTLPITSVAPSVPMLPATPVAPAASAAAPVLTTAAPAMAPEVNPLNRPTAFEAPLTANQAAIQSRLEASAAAYRNAPPGQREQAKQEYANMLAAKAAEAKQAGIQPFSVSQAFGAPQRVASPDEQAKIAKYNVFLERQGINPQGIGKAEMNAQGGLNVPSIPEERKADFVANQAAETLQDYIAAERHARRNARGLKGRDKDAADESVVQARLAKEAYALKSGAIDPRNPTAGMNVDNMRRVAQASLALARDPSSLAARAQQRIMDSTPQKETPADRSQQELEFLANRNREANERWLEEQRRKQQAMFGNLYAGNY